MNSDFAHHFEGGTKMKIPSEISVPLHISRIDATCYQLLHSREKSVFLRFDELLHESIVGLGHDFAHCLKDGTKMNIPS